MREGSTVLVTGRGPTASALARRLVLAGQASNEGSIFVSTTTTARSLLSDCESTQPDLDASQLGVVDATGRADIDFETEALLRSVNSTGDLTGISIGFSVLSTGLGKRGVERIRLCIDSLSLLLLYAEFRTIVRFVHTLRGRIDATDGFGAIVLDESMHDPQVQYALESICDGKIEVRRGTDGFELTTEGLPNQPVDWVSVDL
jgi:KaiC/GvpD/RAD55 family RecA-like ATPase